MLHINNLFLYDNVVIDKEFNGRVDGDQEGRRLAGELLTGLHIFIIICCHMQINGSAFRKGMHTVAILELREQATILGAVYLKDAFVAASCLNCRRTWRSCHLALVKAHVK